MAVQKNSALLQGLGLQEARIPDSGDRAELLFRVEARHCHSVAQGGYVTAWIDAAMAHAVMAATRHEFSCNTLEIKTTFLRPVLQGQTVTALGRVELLGRSIVFLEGELRDQAGKLLAKGSSTARLGRMRVPEGG